MRIISGCFVAGAAADSTGLGVGFSSFTKMSERPRWHSNKTKQNFGLTSFPNASSRASTGTNDEEAPVTLLHFGLPYRWMGLQWVT